MPNLILLYTDPGTGALIWQLLAAAALGMTFYFRLSLIRLKGFLSRKLSKKDTALSLSEEGDI